MRLKVLRSLEEINALENAWNALLEQSASHVPFLRHEYIRTWWETLGGGEWSRGDLFVVLGYEGQGSLAGIAPLFLTENLDREPALMLVGSIEISDYLDLIVSPSNLNTFIAALFDLLAGSQAPDWQVLDLYNIVETSPTLEAMHQEAERRGWVCTQTQLQHCPYIPLPGDWESYLASLDKKQRHEIRRKMRRAENHSLPMRWYTVHDAASLDEEIDAFLALMAQDEEKKRFLTEIMSSQMRAAVHAAYQAGWLQLAFLEFDGEKAASYLNFDFGDHIWVYNSGLNEKFREFSPGWVLLGYLIQQAIEQGRQAFDFMRGDEDYKYRFGAIDRHVVRLAIRKPTAN
jgi:CelD/BcsL family acetyltransferase involved in cellulose biosynthesis